jgi:hypothetical protein
MIKITFSLNDEDGSALSRYLNQFGMRVIIDFPRTRKNIAEWWKETAGNYLRMQAMAFHTQCKNESE